MAINLGQRFPIEACRILNERYLTRNRAGLSTRKLYLPKRERDLRVRVVAAPYFCATKLETFRDRGKGDYLASHDLEDPITVVEGRPELLCRYQKLYSDSRM